MAIKDKKNYLATELGHFLDCNWSKCGRVIAAIEEIFSDLSMEFCCSTKQEFADIFCYTNKNIDYSELLNAVSRVPFSLNEKNNPYNETEKRALYLLAQLLLTQYAKTITKPTPPAYDLLISVAEPGLAALAACHWLNAIFDKNDSIIMPTVKYDSTGKRFNVSTPSVIQPPHVPSVWDGSAETPVETQGGIDCIKFEIFKLIHHQNEWAEDEWNHDNIVYKNIKIPILKDLLKKNYNLGTIPVFFLTIPLDELDNHYIGQENVRRGIKDELGLWVLKYGMPSTKRSTDKNEIESEVNKELISKARLIIIQSILKDHE